VTGLPVPIDLPSRAVLHYRNQLALSLLQQRAPCAETAEVVRQVLTGELDYQFQPSREVS